MKCPNCNYEFKFDWSIEKATIGDEPFVRIDCIGRAFETDKEAHVDYGESRSETCFLYGCPKCGTVKFEIN